MFLFSPESIKEYWESSKATLALLSALEVEKSICPRPAWKDQLLNKLRCIEPSWAKVNHRPYRSAVDDRPLKMLLHLGLVWQTMNKNIHDLYDSSHTITYTVQPEMYWLVPKIPTYQYPLATLTTKTTEFQIQSDHLMGRKLEGHGYQWQLSSPRDVGCPITIKNQQNWFCPILRRDVPQVMARIHLILRCQASRNCNGSLGTSVISF